MRRFGFGERTEQNEESGTWKYEHGHVEFSEKAAKFATQEHPTESPAGAVGLELAAVGGVDLADHVDAPTPEVDYDALADAVEAIDGVGEETASKVVEAVKESL